MQQRDPGLVRIYVDEFGDRGLTPKASPYFALAALILRDTHLDTAREVKRSINRQLLRTDATELHWRENLKGHDRRALATEELGKLPCAISYVVIDKAEWRQRQGSHDQDLIYNFAARLLLERVGWLLKQVQAHGKVTFASVRGMPRRYLDDYLAFLRYDPQMRPLLDRIGKVEVIQAASRDGLQLADIAGGALHSAIVPGSKPPHRLEPMYLQNIAPLIYCRNGKPTSYGLKALGRADFWQQFAWWPALAPLITDLDKRPRRR